MAGISDYETVDRVSTRYNEMLDKLDQLQQDGDDQGWDSVKGDFEAECFDLLGDLLTVID